MNRTPDLLITNGSQTVLYPEVTTRNSIFCCHLATSELLMIEHFFKQRRAVGLGGMGALATMKRSATAAEMHAHSGATREARPIQASAFTSRHDRQVARCIPPGCGDRAGAAE